jgi:hypothetical protein
MHYYGHNVMSFDFPIDDGRNKIVCADLVELNHASPSLIGYTESHVDIRHPYTESRVRHSPSLSIQLELSDVIGRDSNP